MGIGGVALGTRNTAAFPKTRCLQRIHREHCVPCGYQRRHPRATVGLDSDRHLGLVDIVAELFADHRVQTRDPDYSFRESRLAQPPFGRVHQLDIVMLFRPVISDEQLH